MTHDIHSTDQYSFKIAPSKIAGVGVFAVHFIKKGTALTLFLHEDVRLIPYNSPELLSPDVKNFCTWHCIEEKEGYSCPVDFRSMDVGWYLNHSENPNAYHKGYEYFALNDIEQGEEIVIDYETLSDVPQILKTTSLTNTDTIKKTNI